MGQPLPYFDQYNERYPDASQGQMNWLVAVIYLCTMLFFGQLVLAFVNVYKFLYKGEKYKTLPLLLFYVLTVILTLMRLWSNLWFLGYILNQYLLEVLCPILKINIGLNQCWMLLELSLRIRKSITISKGHPTHLSEDSLSQNLESTERKIFWGRLLVLMLIPANLITITVYLVMHGQSSDMQ